MLSGRTLTPPVQPPASVVRAFGGDPGRLDPQAGGRSQAWAAGDIVLKPLDLTPEELRWQHAVLTRLRPQGVRVAPPRATRDGALVVQGWTAWERVEGRHEAGRWEGIVAAGEHLHQALLGVPRPAFFDTRASPWAIADRAAWGEAPLDPYWRIPDVPLLAALRQPLEAPAQVVHGDLARNVLFAPALPPAVIDFSPYWRPTVFATAMVVADALLSGGASAALATSRREPGFAQALVRALLLRLVSDAIIHASPGAQPRSRAVDVAEQLVAAP